MPSDSPVSVVSPSTQGDVPHSDAHPAPSRSHVRRAALWFGLLGGPLAWSVQTLVNLPVTSHGCFPRLIPLGTPITGGMRGIAFVVSVAALITVVAAAAIAWGSWLRTRDERQGDTGGAAHHGAEQALLETGEGRTRFMALAGVLTSLLFLVASLVHAAAIFLVAPCGV